MILRFVVASIALIPALFRGGIAVSRRDLIFFAIAGIFYVPVQFLLQFQGLALTSLAHAAPVVAMLPVFIGMASSLFTKAATPKWIPIVPSALGAVLIVLRPGGHATILGDVLVLLSLLAAVAYVMLSERFVQRYDAIVASTYVLWMGTVALVAFELVLHPHELFTRYNVQPWLATIASGIFCTAMTTLLWNIGLRRVPSADAGVFINLEPLIGAVAGTFLFNDGFGWPLALGGALTIGGPIEVTKTAALAKETAALPPEQNAS